MSLGAFPVDIFPADTGSWRSTVIQDSRGRSVDTQTSTVSPLHRSISIWGTLCAALKRITRSTNPLPFHLTHEDFRFKKRLHRRLRLVVFVVDTSDSMGVNERIASARKAILSLLTSVKYERNRVAIVVFCDDQARVLLAPTHSVTLARDRLRRLPVGGATPMASGIETARRIIHNERFRNPDMEPVLVVISDGEANVPVTPGIEPMDEFHRLGHVLQNDGIRCVLVDTKGSGSIHNEMRHIASHLNGSYRHIHELPNTTA